MYSKTALQADSTKISKLPPPPLRNTLVRRGLGVEVAGRGTVQGLRQFSFCTRDKKETQSQGKKPQTMATITVKKFVKRDC